MPKRENEDWSITAIVWATHRAIFVVLFHSSNKSYMYLSVAFIENQLEHLKMWQVIINQKSFCIHKEKLVLSRIEFSVSGSWNKTSTLRKGQSNFLLSMVINARKISNNFELFKRIVDYKIIHTLMNPLEIISTQRHFFFFPTNSSMRITSKIHASVSTAIASEL